MAGRLIGKGSASSSTVASPSASRRTIERRVGSDSAANTASNRSGAAGAFTGIAAVLRADTSQDSYITERLTLVNRRRKSTPAAGASEGRGAHLAQRHGEVHACALVAAQIDGAAELARHQRVHDRQPEPARLLHREPRRQPHAVIHH